MTLLRLKHCLRRHIQRTSRNEFKGRFSFFLATFRGTIGSVSQQTLRTAVTNWTRKNSRWQRSIYCSATKINVKLRAILQLCWTALKTNRHNRWGFIIPRWNLPGLFTWCKGKMYWIPGNSRNILKFLPRPEVTGRYKKIPPLYLRKNLLATAGNLKVNEQTKYKSVPIFLLFLAVERKPEIRNYWIFESAI